MSCATAVFTSAKCGVLSDSTQTVVYMTLLFSFHCVTLEGNVSGVVLRELDIRHCNQDFSGHRQINQLSKNIPEHCYLFYFIIQRKHLFLGTGCRISFQNKRMFFSVLQTGRADVQIYTIASFQKVHFWFASGLRKNNNACLLLSRSQKQPCFYYTVQPITFCNWPFSNNYNLNSRLIL